MSEFKIPPISTLLGSTMGNFLRAIRYGRIDAKYYHKVFLTSFICIIASPFHLWEKFKDRKLGKLDKPPLFILGHWRSGTTFLHNLLCQDPNTGYVTTYQSVFPNNMHSKLLFKSFMRWKIPGKRPSDNVKLNVDYPQEDDFSLSNMRPAFYEFFYFPDLYKELFDKNVLFKSSNEDEIREWQQAYNKLIIKAKNNTEGKNIILKNPVNTGRINKILELYPQAKFIHIYRNPVVVYLSTKKFFLELIPTLQLQKTTPQQITDLIFDLYTKVMQAYFSQRELIPKDQLIEIAFEVFEKDPMGYLQEIYQRLELENWRDAAPHFEKYLNDLGSYEKNVYRISKEELDRIMKEWQFAFDELGYEVPEGLEII
jgi:hypothetical protein